MTYYYVYQLYMPIFAITFYTDIYYMQNVRLNITEEDRIEIAPIPHPFIQKSDI